MEATRPQLEYIRALIHDCTCRFIEVPHEIYEALEEGIDKEEAAEIIENLKFELGWGE